MRVWAPWWVGVRCGVSAIGSMSVRVHGQEGVRADAGSQRGFVSVTRVYE